MRRLKKVFVLFLIACLFINMPCSDSLAKEVNRFSDKYAEKNDEIVPLRGTPSIIAGDINGDGSVTNKDAILLFRYVAGSKVTVNKDLLDTNGDGLVNNKDAIQLFRYVSGWDVKLYPEIADGETYCISYDIANGDSYLRKQTINNPNPNFYKAGDNFALKSLSVPGYQFLGWFDGAGKNATQIKRINPEYPEDIELFAHWERIGYTVQFMSDIPLDITEKTFTADKETVLPIPNVPNYVFAGWSDEDGKLYKKDTIPAGTSDDMILQANWTSQRNRTWSKPKLDDPIIVEDEENNQILFAYEIGTVQNVPLFTIKDFGYLNGNVPREVVETYEETTSEELMDEYVKSISAATTQSQEWTLSNEWTESTDVDEEWCETNGYTKETAREVGKSSSNTWNISSGKEVSTDISHTETDKDGSINEVKINSKQIDSHSTENKTTTNHEVGLGIKMGSQSDSGFKIGIGKKFEFGIDGGNKTREESLSAKVAKEKSTTTTDSKTNEVGLEASTSNSHEDASSDTLSNNVSFNTEASYGGSSSSSVKDSVKQVLSEEISKKTSYGKGYINSTGQSDTQGVSCSQSSEDEYKSAVSYSTVKKSSKTLTWETKNVKPGYHRWVIAGIAHVFGVVGYDLSKEAFFTYTYSIMDDYTYEFEDYSTNARYDDQENGVLPFEIPADIAYYVADKTCATEGLKCTTDGKITSYTGTDSLVVIPEYINDGQGDIIKVTSIDENAFKGNTEVKEIILSDYIETIPAKAFEGCSSLIGVYGAGINTIEEAAFKGCTSLDFMGIYSGTKITGKDAFDGVEKVYINPYDEQTLENAIASGASKIVIYNNSFDAEEDKKLEGKTLVIPEGTEYFQLDGYGKTYNDVCFDINSDECVLNKCNFACGNGIPIKTLAGKLVLNQTNITAPAIALALTSDLTQVGLQGTNAIKSVNGTNAVLCKSIELFESNSKVVGKMSIPDENDKFLYTGTIKGKNLLSALDTQILKIDNDRFDSLLNSFVLTFDANGGSCAESSMIVANGSAPGELPVANRDYYSFDGWYTEPSGGEKISAEKVMIADEEMVVYAHWIHNPVSAWVSATDIPAGAEVVSRKWLYDKTSYTESTNTSLAGWSSNGSYWVESGRNQFNYSTEFPSTFDTNNWYYTNYRKGPESAFETTTTKRTVSNTWSGYIYWHWMYDCGGGKGTSERAIYDRYGYGPTNDYLYKYFGAFASATDYKNGGNTYCNNLGKTNYIVNDRTANSDCQGSLRWFRFNYYTCSYTDYYKVFMYKKVETNLESNTPVSDTNISNVREMVQYRAK